MCGIFGFNSKAKSHFSWDKFNILGLFNDTRGGDACGLAAGQNLIHDNDKFKRFPDLVANFYVPEVDKEVKSIFGHSRKSSVYHGGLKHIEHTQPIAFRDDDLNITKIGIHNGTIYNHEKLAKEYGVPKTFTYVNSEGESSEYEMNDSQVLLYILCELNDYSVLTKYEGTAALAWYDYNTEELKLYSGSSLGSENTKVASRERPLFIGEFKNHIWFSSIIDPLKIISNNEDDNIHSVPENTILIIKNGKVIDSIFNNDTNREKCSGYKVYTKTYNTKVDPWYKKDHNKFKTEFKPYTKSSPAYTASNKLDDEEIPANTFGVERKLVFARGRYWFMEKPAHGIYHVDEIGYVNRTKKTIMTNKNHYSTYANIEHDAPITEGKAQKTMPYYFINGNMINDHFDFNKAIRIWNSIKNTYNKHSINVILSKYFVYPSCTEGIPNSCIKYNEDRRAASYFNGEFQPLWSAYEYEFNLGKFMSRSLPMNGPAIANHETITVVDEDDCIACKGTGISSKGGVCVACEGTGRKFIDTVDDNMEDDDCAWCEGTGMDEYGNNCVWCEGTGKILGTVIKGSEDNTKEYESTFEAYENDAYRDIAKTEVQKELSDVLRVLDSAIHNIEEYTQYDNSVEKVYDTLMEVETILNLTEKSL